MEFAVLVMRKDGTKEFFPGCHIAGYWNGDLILSSGEQGIGVSVRVDHREPAENVLRVEVVARDEDDDQTAADWEIGSAHYPITREGAVILRAFIERVAEWVTTDRGNRTSMSGGRWMQPGIVAYRAPGASGVMAQAHAAGYGVPMTKYLPPSWGPMPKALVAVSYPSHEMVRTNGDAATHIAVRGGWKLVVDAEDANPEIDVRDGGAVGWIGAEVLGATQDPDARFFKTGYTVKEAANAVLTGRTPAREDQAWRQPTRIECEDCPINSGWTAEHDLLAGTNTIEHLIHIADLILVRDGWPSTGVPVPGTR